jgi:hypothetical protein
MRILMSVYNGEKNLKYVRNYHFYNFNMRKTFLTPSWIKNHFFLDLENLLEMFLKLADQQIGNFVPRLARSGWRTTNYFYFCSIFRILRLSEKFPDITNSFYLQRHQTF